MVVCPIKTLKQAYHIQCRATGNALKPYDDLLKQAIEYSAELPVPQETSSWSSRPSEYPRIMGISNEVSVTACYGGFISSTYMTYQMYFKDLED